MVVGSNDTPSRSLGNVGDFNGGLQNLPRFLESWDSGAVSTNIQGSFIQFGRSAYNTAPYIPILDLEASQQTSFTPLSCGVFSIHRQTHRAQPHPQSLTMAVFQKLSYRTDAATVAFPSSALLLGIGVMTWAYYLSRPTCLPESSRLLPQNAPRTSISRKYLAMMSGYKHCCVPSLMTLRGQRKLSVAICAQQIHSANLKQVPNHE
ncbi:MAG: hypothetical protein U7126_08250 [Microcoleus sp.]